MYSSRAQAETREAEGAGEGGGAQKRKEQKSSSVNWPGLLHVVVRLGCGDVRGLREEILVELGQEPERAGGEKCGVILINKRPLGHLTNSTGHESNDGSTSGIPRYPWISRHKSRTPCPLPE